MLFVASLMEMNHTSDDCMILYHVAHSLITLEFHPLKVKEGHPVIPTKNDMRQFLQ